MTTRQIIILASCCLLSALAAVALDRAFFPHDRIIIRETQNAQLASQQWLNEIRPRTFLSSSPTNFTASAEAVTSSVVFIRTVEKEGFSLFGKKEKGPITTSSGSGVIISEDGYIITNNHVIEVGNEVQVTLSDKREFVAEVIGADPSTDLALIRVVSENVLPFIELGNSDSLRVGEWVLAVGNPFNLESTVTAGIVSAKGRDIDILEGQDRIESFIQTDAVVNPGNSGGALVNTNGELIGINTAIITRSGGYEGYSFAIPSNLARKIIRDLRDYGTVQRGLLGVYIQDVTAALADELGLEKVEGVVITRLSDDGSAELAGLKAGDIIIGINGQPTKARPALQELLGQLRPGNEIRITYLRNGEEREANVVLKNKINSTHPLSAKEEALLHDLGFEARNLTPEEINRVEVAGAKIMSVFRKSKIANTNLEPGFIITNVNDEKVESVEELIDILENISGKVVFSGVYENYTGEYYYAFMMD